MKMCVSHQNWSWPRENSSPLLPAIPSGPASGSVVSPCTEHKGRTCLWWEFSPFNRSWLDVQSKFLALEAARLFTLVSHLKNTTDPLSVMPVIIYVWHLDLKMDILLVVTLFKIDDTPSRIWIWLYFSNTGTWQAFFFSMYITVLSFP